MEIVLDTNILVGACSSHDWDCIQTMCALRNCSSGKTTKRLCVDIADVILQEYRNRVGAKRLYVKWFTEISRANVIHRYDGRLDNRHASALRELGCHEPTDHVFVAVAAASADKTLVSEDSDFGMGSKGSTGKHPHAKRYLQNDMGITLLNAKDAVQRLKTS